MKSRRWAPSKEFKLYLKKIFKPPEMKRRSVRLRDDRQKPQRHRQRRPHRGRRQVTDDSLMSACFYGGEICWICGLICLIFIWTFNLLVLICCRSRLWTARNKSFIQLLKLKLKTLKHACRGFRQKRVFLSCRMSLESYFWRLRSSDWVLDRIRHV